MDINEMVELKRARLSAERCVEISLDKARERLARYGGRVRIYGLFTQGESVGQIARLASEFYVDKYGHDMGLIWESRATMADMIHRA